MSLAVTCPNCGAEVAFRSAALPARVCDYCRALLVRSDAGVGVAGETAALPFDVSPIQLGLRGRDGKSEFEVVGRVRWAWTDGTWNEWFLLYADGSAGWLGDAIGQFMLLRERPVGGSVANVVRDVIAGEKAKVGHDAQIDGVKYLVNDARDVMLIAAEGELPFTPKAGTRAYSVDLRGKAGECASLQRDALGITLYTGRYVKLRELAPRGLRRFEGWALPAYAG